MTSRLHGRLTKAESRAPDQPDEYGFKAEQRAQIELESRRAALLWGEFVAAAEPALFDKAHERLKRWAGMEVDLKTFEGLLAAANQGKPLGWYYKYAPGGADDGVTHALRPVLQGFWAWSGRHSRSFMLHSVTMKFGVESYVQALQAA